MTASIIAAVLSLILAGYGITHDFFGSTVKAVVESPANASWQMESELEVWADSSESFNVIESRWRFLDRREIFYISWDGSGRDMVTCNWSKDGSLFIVYKLGQPVCVYDFKSGSLLAQDRPMPENSQPIMFFCGVAGGAKTIPSVEFENMIESRGGKGQKIEWVYKR